MAPLELPTIEDFSSDSEATTFRTPALLPLQSSTYEIAKESIDSEDDQSPRGFVRIPARAANGIEAIDISSESESDASGSSEADDLQGQIRSGASDRDLFKQTLAYMESAEDIRLLYPRSLHPEFEYQETIWSERDILDDWVPCHSIPETTVDQEDDSYFEQLELSDFCIYRALGHKRGSNGQFEDLHTVCSEKNTALFYVDGLICHQGEERRIVGAEIQDVNIGGLDSPQLHTTTGQIWIQTSQSASKSDCWYLLTRPSDDYATRWRDFLWLAELNKHFVDYLCHMSRSSESVHLRHLESSFFKKISSWHREDPSFQAWSQRAATNDYRIYLSMHASFLRDQAWSVSAQLDFDLDLHSHPVWDEVGCGRYTKDQQKSSKEEQTVVTPYIRTYFERAFPRWGREKYNLLRSIEACPEVASIGVVRRTELGFPTQPAPIAPSSQHRPVDVSSLLENAALRNESIEANPRSLVNKVVIVRLADPSEHYEFALVKIALTATSMHVNWLVQPRSTMAAYDESGAFYPATNELFYTDSCNCDPISLRQIVACFDVATVGETAGREAILIHQLYKENKIEASFSVPTESELTCGCGLLDSKTRDLRRQQSADSRQQLPAKPTIPKVRNFSIFSGSGLLDFGLEESGSIETVMAIDNNELAVCSHTANSHSSCEHVFGSVNGYLKQILRGHIPLPFIHCLSAGCPCKGFSMLNAYRKKKNGQRNCSLLASTLSYIETMLPEYALIENVPEMDRDDPEGANACAQAISCLVGLGYQVRKMLLAADDYGAPTSRLRLFLLAAAPAVELPSRPKTTHGPGKKLKPTNTVRDALKDLEPIHNDTVINVEDPSHVPAQRLRPNMIYNVSQRNVLSRIPKRPGSNLYQAYQHGLLSREQREWFFDLSEERQSSSSKALQRVDPNGPFKTIAAVVSPLDSRSGGRIIHPTQDRLLSLKELRRAQGIPDSFLLMGNILQQIEQVGNGVAWQVASAIGHPIVEAWVRSYDSGRAKRLERIHNEYSGHAAALTGSSPERQPPIERMEAITKDEREVKEDVLSPAPSKLETRDMKAEEGAKSLNGGPPNEESTPEDSIDVHEFSENESLVVEPNGTWRYKHHRRDKITRRSSSSSNKRVERATVNIPIGTHTQAKRSAEKPGDESDSDVQYLETRPIAKRPRM